MAKFLYSAAMSLDGFIAGPDGRHVVDDRLSRPESRCGRPDFANRCTTGRQSYLRRRRPYKGQEGEGEAFGGGWEGPQFVLTHRLPAEQVPGVTFIGDIDSAIANSRAAAGDGYVNILGANVAAQCLEAGVLDEVLVSVTPLLLGDGTRLFEQPGGETVRLEQISVTHTPQVTNLWYRVTA
jgi:hypothetical protein